MRCKVLAAVMLVLVVLPAACPVAVLGDANVDHGGPCRIHQLGEIGQSRNPRLDRQAETGQRYTEDDKHQCFFHITPRSKNSDAPLTGPRLHKLVLPAPH